MNIAETKVCNDCNKALPVAEFYKRGKNRLRYYGVCRGCFSLKRSYTARGYKRDPIKKKIMNAEYRKNNKEKIFAQNALNRAVAKGSVVKASHCEHCREPKSVHGHHTDYSKPFEVLWLCNSCHTKEHIRIKSRPHPMKDRAL